MPLRTRTGKALQVYLDADLREQLDRIAEANCRAISAEVRAALKRYVQSPEVIQMPTPEPPQPKRPVGRPRKESGK